MRLTTRAVEAARPGTARREIADSIIIGLYLIISHLTGTKSWCVRYRFRGISRKLTLGRFPALSLKDARELAARALRAVAEGRDPAREKVEARSARVDSIDSVVAEFLERHVKRTNRPRTQYEVERLLRVHVLPKWHGRLIRDIAKRDVLDLLDHVVDGGTPILANRLLATIRKMFAWAVARDILTVSPCTGITPPSVEQSRDRTLSDDELRLVWQAAEQVGYPFGTMTQVLILTGQRRDEVAKARWSEIDIARRLWRLPPERMKNNKPHEVFLSTATIAVLQSLPRFAGSNYVFTTDGTTSSTGFSRGKTCLDALLPVTIPHWVLHDLRRSVASGMAKLGVQLPVVEKILGHTSGSFRGVAGIYQRHDYASEKAKALETWGQHIVGLTSKKVVQLRGASRG
jgi:integrase